MAIQFTQQTPQGATVEYNVVKNMSYNPDADTTSVVLKSYINKDAMDAGAMAFPGQGFTFPGQLTVADAQATIIALPEWEGATIVD